MSNDVPMSGIYINDKSDNAPEWVLGKISVQLDKFRECVKYAMDNELVSQKGYIYLDIKLSKKGEKYVGLNTYKGKTEEKAEEPSQEDMPF